MFDYFEFSFFPSLSRKGVSQNGVGDQASVILSFLFNFKQYEMLKIGWIDVINEEECYFQVSLWPCQ